MEENMIMEVETTVVEDEATEVMAVEGGSKGNVALIGLAAAAGVSVVVGLGKKFIAPHFTAEARKERLQKRIDKLDAKIAAEVEDETSDDETKNKKFNPKKLFEMKTKKEEAEEA